ncbi:hypothetical protein [Paenibacillus prosopidis]|uniref:TadE-like protein n=1 Tax=Paenibacillus prosopidis TaxID=630520 RepID=A0A368VQU6_9BACL|nr:hypothetical protein [Paenibacillus prosopidis]RCW41657.1 hypothetical protein DFP97_12293 [Paenibacillus prosopidis]
MFNKALAEILTVYFLILYLFQPPLHELFNVRSNAVEIVLNQGIAKAASLDNGYFTPEIIQEMKDTLRVKFFIPESSVTFTGTNVPMPRGEYIEGTLKVKASPLWIFQNLAGSDNAPKYITRHATMMSEYMER